MPQLFENTYFIILESTGAMVVFVFWLMYLFPPKKINAFYGYRTYSSKKSQRNWDFSQKYAAKWFMLYGLIQMLSAPLASLIEPIQFAMEKHRVFLALSVMIIFMAVPIIQTEYQLKKLEKNNNMK